MIICSNCGAINSDESSRFCRKCGALLPVIAKPSKIRIPTPGSKNQKKEINPSVINTTAEKTTTSIKTNQNIPYLNREAGIFAPKVNKTEKPNQLELQEIPKPQIKKNLPKVAEIPPKIIKTEELKSDLMEITVKIPEEHKKGEKEFLKEITPKPFNGTIKASKSAYGPPKKGLDIDLSTKSKSKGLKAEEALLRQKQLEEDMSDVLAVLSKKISISKEKISQPKPSKIKKEEKEIVPSSMNEILTQLLNLDKFIEASALIKRDGTILASALSNRISDSLFLTIGQNLSMIGSDIIEGLSAGKLDSISIRGSEGVFDLAPLPIDKRIPELTDMILMIFSHPRVKPGIISFAVNIVKKQIKDYLGVK
ncbi:MAG: zinc-ribbon domain-containing protein [Promethearchaeota archaeon]